MTIIISRELYTCTMSPMTKIIVTQEMMSAWFWITNSWLIIGGFLLEFFLPLIATILTYFHFSTGGEENSDRGPVLGRPSARNVAVYRSKRSPSQPRSVSVTRKAMTCHATSRHADALLWKTQRCCC